MLALAGVEVGLLGGVLVLRVGGVDGDEVAWRLRDAILVVRYGGLGWASYPEC